MIRTNLSTRPFYNVAAVRLWLAVGSGLVLAATAFNVAQVLRYSNTNTELVTRASNDEARAATLRTSAQALRASVDAAQVDLVSVDARQANDLIDRRTFSWTDLFNRFEHTLPDDVRITSVHPVIDKDRRIVLTVNVVAREVDDVNKFMENLDQTASFVDLHSRQEQMTQEGLLESSLEMVYKPSAPLAPSEGAAPSATAGAAVAQGAPGAVPAAAKGGGR